MAIDQPGERDEITAGQHQHGYRRSEFMQHQLRAPQQSVDFIHLLVLSSLPQLSMPRQGNGQKNSNVPQHPAQKPFQLTRFHRRKAS
jgi:hypothetical protein